MLVRVYAPAPGEEGGTAVADELGLSPAALRQRCSRARHNLAAAVRADAKGLPIQVRGAHPTSRQRHQAHRTTGLASPSERAALQHLRVIHVRRHSHAPENLIPPSTT
jgi:hypothetical protein